VPGLSTGALPAGSGNTHIATLEECKSRFASRVKTFSKDTQTLVKAFQRRVRKLPKQLKRTLHGVALVDPNLVRGGSMGATPLLGALGT
jgi:hypothetical protein